MSIVLIPLVKGSSGGYFKDVWKRNFMTALVLAKAVR
jgi:hypothetical protein